MWDPCLSQATSNTTVISEILDTIKCVSKFNVSQIWGLPED